MRGRFVATAYNRPAVLARWLREIATLSQNREDVAVCVVGFEGDSPPLKDQVDFLHPHTERFGS